jgi:hypothetical protein
MSGMNPPNSPVLSPSGPLGEEGPGEEALTSPSTRNSSPKELPRLSPSLPPWPLTLRPLPFTLCYLPMAIGYWLSAIGYRLLAIVYWLSSIGYRLLAIVYWLSGSRSLPLPIERPVTFPGLLPCRPTSTQG